MPFYRERLLSAWGNERFFEVGKPPATIDPDILKNLRPNPGGIGQIAPNPRRLFRNQVEETKPTGTNGTTFAAPKLLSAKPREAESNPSSRTSIRGATEALLNTALSENTKADVPDYYVNLTIQFGPKLGIMDFDFKYVCRVNSILLTDHRAGSTTEHAIPA